LIEIGLDEASFITEHLQDVVTQIAKESLNTKFYRVGVSFINLIWS